MAEQDFFGSLLSGVYGGLEQQKQKAIMLADQEWKRAAQQHQADKFQFDKDTTATDFDLRNRELVQRRQIADQGLNNDAAKIAADTQRYNDQLTETKRYHDVLAESAKVKGTQAQDKAKQDRITRYAMELVRQYVPADEAWAESARRVNVEDTANPVLPEHGMELPGTGGDPGVAPQPMEPQLSQDTAMQNLMQVLSGGQQGQSQQAAAVGGFDGSKPTPKFDLMQRRVAGTEQNIGINQKKLSIAERRLTLEAARDLVYKNRTEYMTARDKQKTPAEIAAMKSLTALHDQQKQNIQQQIKIDADIEARRQRLAPYEDEIVFAKSDEAKIKRITQDNFSQVRASMDKYGKDWDASRKELQSLHKQVDSLKGQFNGEIPPEGTPERASYDDFEANILKGTVTDQANEVNFYHYQGLLKKAGLWKPRAELDSKARESTRDVPTFKITPEVEVRKRQPGGSLSAPSKPAAAPTGRSGKPLSAKDKVLQKFKL